MRAERDAVRAAEATARDLRRALLDPRTLGLVADEERFAVEAGRVVEPPGTAPLPADDPRAGLPAGLRVSLDDLDADPGAFARCAAAAGGLAEPERAWVELRLAWHAHRTGDAATRDAVLAAVDARVTGAEPFAATAASAVLLAATIGAAPPGWAVGALPRGPAELAVGTALRLRELGATASADALDAARQRVDLRRHVIGCARRALALHAGGPAAIAIDDMLVLLSADRSAGAVVEPLRLVAALRDAEALVVPWSGRLTPEPGTDAIVVVPGLIAVAPDAPRVDRGGLVGFGLVLVACSCLFLGGWFATRRALRREADALHARAEFLTSVTHELKTPLASLRLLAERLAAGRVRGVEKQQEYFALLAGEAGRLSVLIENVLDLGRAERGERALDLRPHVLDDVVREAVAVVRPIAGADGTTIECAFGAAASEGRVDRVALGQIVVNLLDNARKYARAGRRIEVATGVRDGRFELTVRDHGPGVPDAERERIFARFARGRAQGDGSVPGVGLGLYLARTVARACGGELEHVAPDDGGPGAAFVLRVPLLPNGVPDPAGRSS